MTINQSQRNGIENPTIIVCLHALTKHTPRRHKEDLPTLGNWRHWPTALLTRILYVWIPIPIPPYSMFPVVEKHFYWVYWVYHTTQILTPIHRHIYSTTLLKWAGENAVIWNLSWLYIYILHSLVYVPNVENSYFPFSSSSQVYGSRKEKSWAQRGYGD